MFLARSGVSLLLGLAAFAAVASASADSPAPAGAPRSTPTLQVAIDRDERAKRAMALHDEALVLYEDGRYGAAIDKLEAALRIDPDGRELVYNLALVHEKLGHLKEASRYYQRYLETETDPKAKARTQAILRRLEGAEKQAAASPLSSLPPVPDPVPPSPPRRPVRPWVVATASISGVAFAIGFIFGLMALERNPGAGARTGGGVTFQDLQGAAGVAHTDARIADASFVVTAAAAGAAICLYLTTPRRSAPLRAVAVGPGVLQVRF